jgi:hypothetical protein
MAQRKKSAGAGRSQRERLLSRPRPSLPYPIRVVDPTEARQRLAEVQQLARQALLRHDKGSPEYRAAQERVVEAEAVVDACYATVMITALHPAVYEALKAEHPPKSEPEGDGDPADVDVDTFVPAVLAAGTDAGMSAEDWAAFLAEHCSDGERQELRVLVLGLNERARFVDSVVLPKGLTGMPSWPLS